MDRQQYYANLDSILSGTIKPHLIRNAEDETVRVIASIGERIVSPSLVLHRLGSYARQTVSTRRFRKLAVFKRRFTF
jgi:TnpA family transposase